MGFNKTVNSFDELGVVLKGFNRGILKAVEKSIDISGETGLVFLKNYILSKANWDGILMSSIKFDDAGKFIYRILVTAPHAKFLNEGVRPHRVTRYNKDGSLRESLSGRPFGDWLDEHGMEGLNVIWVARSKASPLTKPGLRFIPKTAEHLSKLLPNILEDKIKLEMEAV